MADSQADPPETNELAFLRFFYKAAGAAFGPADSDIYDMIGEDFEAHTGLSLPASYRRDED